MIGLASLPNDEDVGVAGIPRTWGADTSGLETNGGFQIRSRQDWDRGLRGEIDGNRRCRIGMLMATKGAAEGMETAADSAVYSDGRSELRDSLIDPWKFEIELTQQSGRGEGLGGRVFALAGQQACAWRWAGWQIALNPETCTRKIASRRYIKRCNSYPSDFIVTSLPLRGKLALTAVIFTSPR